MYDAAEAEMVGGNAAEARMAGTTRRGTRMVEDGGAGAGIEEGFGGCARWAERG
jgi:hypothetical protein